MLANQWLYLNLLNRYNNTISSCSTFAVPTMQKKIKTFAFLDLETTGLPYLENYKTKITELCMITVQSEHIELGCYPRVLNKLNLCLNPNKLVLPETEKITGLSNYVLENQKPFDAETANLLRLFLDSHRKPICLVAHNGLNFDYPILKRELHLIDESLDCELLCVDSLDAFRSLDAYPEIGAVPPTNDTNTAETEIFVQPTAEQMQKINETTPRKSVINRNKDEVDWQKKRTFNVRSTSYKLQDVYQRLTGKKVIKAHEAEADVMMIIHCAASYAERFTAYAHSECTLFQDIQMLTPGNKICRRS